MFGPSFKAGKVKTLLNLAKARMKLLRNKRENALKQMRRDIATQLSNNQEGSARIRVEHIMREQNILAAYDVLELFCELIVVRLPIIEQQKECPSDMRESVSSVIFAAPRCADLPELMQARQTFQAKYGKEFIAAADELRPGSGVNRTIIEKLSVRAPSGEAKLKLLIEIAEEHKLDWDASKSEEALVLKQDEDLLVLPQYNGHIDERYNEPGPSGIDPRYRGGGPGGTGGGGAAMMEPLGPSLNFQNPPASAPPKTQQWVDPETMNDDWASGKGRGGAAPSAPGGGSRQSPLDYPAGPPVVPASGRGGAGSGGTGGSGGAQGPEPGAGFGPGLGRNYPPEPPVKVQPSQVEENYTMVYNMKQEEERRQRKQNIQDIAARARESAMKAAEAAKAAAQLTTSHSLENATPGGAKGGAAVDEDEEHLRPVKPSFVSPSVDAEYAPPARSSGGSYGGGKGGAGGGGFMAVARYGMGGGEDERGAANGSERRGSDPPFVPSAPPGYATGSTFDDYVDTGRAGKEKDEVDLPDPPGPAPPRAGSGLPGIDDLAARFDKLRERSGHMGGYQ